MCKLFKQLIQVVLILSASFITQTGGAQTEKVGIGTTKPAEKLDVAGNIKADTLKPKALKILTNAGSGKVLTSDANGIATWQSTQTAAEGFGSWGDCVSGISEYQPVGDSLGRAFGKSVSISGNYAIVGDYSENVGGNTAQGSASIYQFTGGKWVLMQKLVDTDGAASDGFGYSVSISGIHAIVGVPYDDVGANANQGSAVTYFLSGGTWFRLNKITDPTGAAVDYFGVSVSISGNWAIIGSPYDDAPETDRGTICFFTYQAPSWSFKQKLAMSGGAAGDQFGASVSISGTRAIAGAAPDDVGSKINQGSATIYTYNGSAWAAMETITDPAGAGADYFGGSVSISGNYVIVGVKDDEVGANTDQGSACIFWYNGTTWAFQQRLTDPNGDVNDSFGNSVSINGNYAMVGAQYDDVGGNANQGSATIYTRVGSTWRKIQYISDPGGNKDDYFGDNVSIEGNTRQFIIGSSANIAVFGKVN
jgi:hypothetical protein